MVPTHSDFRFFRKVDLSFSLAEILAELEGNEMLWLANTSRQEKNKVQENTHAITLRGAVPRSDLKIWENQEDREAEAIRFFPKIAALLYSIAEHHSSHLSRAKLVRLKPELPVGMHTDKGSYYLIRQRYHLVLRSKNGSILQSGNEMVTMKEGELWWFDNKQHHSSFNPSDDWRIHIIFDLLPKELAKLAVNPVPIETIAQRKELSEYLRMIPMRDSSIPRSGRVQAEEEH
ncbi:aspartyl/asparaginyl beta-hydroxylase domain-containing protein [Agrobacterium rhizogenes]|uniref:aspartyl/asparaginyl beta-hydroxylase domain-containing protein n=1 Tax=Rhizobium rhizogenes TaxID=359 RepID=UPI00068CCB56|nr:aspartyl/asparaginyl beta-hydroxylase domain-containing protein [Rhizobium rhizogenes]NTG91106.1 aspartyl/asparaginyl beta-hydroxylase domain-containing protein [Rhizobium rhizogenes]NTI19904.1 aspartyl/asparaginyl beta-hydroxylase domain-containing protein [Rhizobium rhizogenes]QRM40605.1 aspartyl/asparaginyl beta-hydroxylase domain-containing protein [Rhizobium rhizogenes]